jgi:hypothetical protein
MKTLLTVNLSTKKALAGSTDWAPPEAVFGEAWTLALRFLQSVDGETIEPTLDVRSIVAALGPVDARPDSGEFALQVGPGIETEDNTTEAIPYDAEPNVLAAAINANAAIVTAYGTAVAEKVDGSWKIRFGTGLVQVPLRVRSNKLWPISIGRISAAIADGIWEHELRLVQAPYSFTDAGEEVLPPAPAIERVASGGSGGGYEYNEIQSLFVPPDFRASYRLKFGPYARTAALSRADNAESIQAALVEVLGENVEVTNSNEFTALIEFTNELGGTANDLLEVVPLEAPPGDLTFTLPFDRAELHARLRREERVVLPLEVRIQVADADEVITEVVAFRQDITVLRPLIFPELATVPAIDWLRPPSPKDYVPFNPDNVITGHQFHTALVGDGILTSFAIAHGLETDAVFVVVRENTSPGAQLVQGVDFDVVVDDDESVTVSAIGAAPGVNEWAVMIISAQTVSAFAEDLEIEIGQVTGLQDQLDTIGDQLQELLDLVPVTPLGVTRSLSGGDAMTIEIPGVDETFPKKATIEGGKVVGTRPRPGGLLPAIHDATVTDVTELPDVAASAGNVVKNTSGAALLIPGGLGTRGSYLAVNGFAGSDGRRWYPLSRAGATNSYFPRDFERTLFSFSVNSAMLRAGTTLALEFKLALQLFDATSGAQYLVVIEHGTVAGQSTPDPTGTNLQDIVWNATPLLSLRVVVNANKVTHRFGAEIIRAAGGALSANKSLYDFATAADSVPASADFSLRARLIQFDTENSVAGAVGTIFYSLSEGKAVLNTK